MKSISMDIETYSQVDLVKSGVYPYSESEDFQILLFSYAVDDNEVQVVDLAKGEIIPGEIIEAFFDNDVIKYAFNANFERICLSKHLKKYIPPTSWRCTMVMAAMMGLPLSLKKVGEILQLDEQKMKEGEDLIRFFSLGSSIKKRNMPEDDEEKWEMFKEYNKRDVQVEREIRQILSKYLNCEDEWKNYEMDQFINDRGILLHMDFVRKAIYYDEICKVEHTEKLRRLTKLQNPNSVMQMKAWLKSKGVEVGSLSQEIIGELLEETTGEVREALLLRKELSKSSVKKYAAMENVVCKDKRARGLFQFYGANKTGRFAGRLVQVQNLPQNHLSDLEEVRALVESGNFKEVELRYDSVKDVLSQLIRTSFIPKEGCKFIVADFFAIEARILAWFAGEKWRMDVFKENKDIYCESASKMFGVVVQKDGINAHLRQKGKIAELALGYGGSVGALKIMGATKMGIGEDDLNQMVKVWRNANSAITNLWWNMDKSVKRVIHKKTPMSAYGLNIYYEDNILFIKLPSGRKLVYQNPRLEENKFGGMSIIYDGIGGSKRWGEIETYGPKIVENIVQGIARDLLCFAMRNLSEEGYEIVMHVHDEVVVEVKKEKCFVEDVLNIMCKSPAWAEDLVLSAEGYECEFYHKK